MTDFSDYSDHYDAEARLVILKALDDEPAKTLNDSLLLSILRGYAINRDRDYLRTQLGWMQSNGGAVELKQAGTAIIATLTERGANHLARITPISGIKLPSLPR